MNFRKRMATVNHSDLEEALAFVRSEPSMESAAYIARDTGEIYFTSEIDSLDAEVPDDLETSDQYVAIPHKNDLGLGRDLALLFVAQRLPDHSGGARAIFRQPGAYARFKSLLQSQGLQQDWFRFEADATATALRAWCAENGIEVI
jgi:hypothetical protein